MGFQLLASGATVASTYGWDTVSAVRIGDMNRAIVEASSSPKAFQQAIDGAEAHVSADFGDWQIDNGGDGRLIHLTLPLLNIQARYQAQTWRGDAVARVEVQLHFLPHALLQSDGISQRHQLVLRTTPTQENLPVANVLDLLFDAPDSDPGAIFSALVKLGLKDWLCANLDQFTHVFATVNIYQMITDDAFNWLKPTYATYVFLAKPNPDESIFGILCRTGKRSYDSLIEQISPYAIPEGASSGFLLAPERMLSDMMARSLPTMLQGLHVKDIKVDEARRSLSVDKTVPLQRITDKDGRTFQPMLEKLQVELRERDLIMSSTISTVVSPGIRSVGESQSFFHIGLVTKPDGTRTLGYRESRPAIKRDYIRKNEGVVIFEWMLLVGALIVGIATFWTGFGVGLIIAALVIGGATITLEVIEAVHNDDAPAIDLFVNQATDSISWGNAPAFQLTSAELNGALQIGGEFTGKGQ